MTPEEYVKLIKQNVETPRDQTLYPGQIYSDLYKYLSRGIAITPRKGYKTTDRISHAVLYIPKVPNSSTQTFADPKSCARILSDSHDTPKVLFLRGLSSASWMAEVGAVLQTDPEFWNSNLLFRVRQEYFSYPALPSAYRNIIRLRIVTIGSRGSRNPYESNPNVIARLRRDAEKRMRNYRDRLVGSNMPLCESIVRDFFVLDEQHFALEQEISICLHYHQNSWTALVSLDPGSSLLESQGLWPTNAKERGQQENLYPIVQHGERDWKERLEIIDGKQTANHQRSPQSATLIPLGYGCLLDQETMANDPFYALDDLFRISASSQNQFMGLIEEVITKDTDYKSLAHEQPTLSTLLYCRGILEEHIKRFKVSLSEIASHKRYREPFLSSANAKSRDNLKAMERRADAAAANRLEDYKHLLDRAKSLYERCNTGMTNISNNVMLAENRKVLLQNKFLQKLTIIGYLYIPLSFTTSLFGMNVKQLGSGTSDFRVWAVVSVPVLILTMIVFFVDERRVRDVLDRARRSLDRSTLPTNADSTENNLA